MNFLFDPKIFNFIIIGLYAMNATRWAVYGSYADMFYWLGALWITLAVTFGYTR